MVNNLKKFESFMLSVNKMLVTPKLLAERWHFTINKTLGLKKMLIMFCLCLYTLYISLRMYEQSRRTENNNIANYCSPHYNESDDACRSDFLVYVWEGTCFILDGIYKCQ